MRIWTRILLSGLLLFGLVPPGAGAGREELAAGMVNPGHHEQPAWFKQSFLDLREDVAEAAAAGRRLVLYFYQDGCPYCKKLLEVNLSQRAIADPMRKGFDVVAINIWGDREVTDLAGRQTTEKHLAEALRVMFTPTLLFFDEQGRVVARINGYFPPHRFKAVLDYVAGHQERRQSLRDYLAAHTPHAASGRLHVERDFLQPPYRLAAYSRRRPLLVLFEQKDCRACDRLHQDILQRPESRALLRRLDVAVVDSWSRQPLQTPAGRTLPARDWAEQLKILYTPTLVFFVDGREVFRAEAQLYAFHVQSVMDYVLSGAYRTQPSFQRYIQARADALRARGIEVDITR